MDPYKENRTIKYLFIKLIKSTIRTQQNMLYSGRIKHKRITQTKTVIYSSYTVIIQYIVISLF